MSTLYLDRRDVTLKAEGKALVIFIANAREGTVPFSVLERVVVNASVTLSTGVIGALAEAGIGLVAVSGRKSERVAILYGRPHNEVRRRLAQAAHYLDPACRTEWARDLVAAKLFAQHRLLQRARGQRPDRRRQLTRALETIERCQCKLGGNAGLTGIAAGLGELRGIEGAASAAYFRAFGVLFPASLGFEGRNRRPPRDPVNACLSLGYTLLHAETALACYATGLDPLLGLYHEPDYGRESLACDLVEPLRPHVDQFVWELFRSRRLEETHFGSQGSESAAVLLGKAGRRIFYAEWEVFARPMRRLLRRVCYDVGRRWVEDFEVRRLVNGQEPSEDAG